MSGVPGMFDMPDMPDIQKHGMPGTLDLPVTHGMPGYLECTELV